MWSPMINPYCTFSYQVQQPVRPAVPPSNTSPFLSSSTGIIKSKKRVAAPLFRTEKVESLEDVASKIVKTAKLEGQADEIALLNGCLNAALLDHPCMLPKQYQLRVLQLSALLDAVPLSDEWCQLRTDLTKHLLNTQEEAERYYERSCLEGFWPLHAGIFALPEAMPDAFGNAVGGLREMVQSCKVNKGWAVQVRDLLSRLLPPASFCLPDDQKAVEGLILSCTTLIFILRAVPDLEKVKMLLGTIREAYKSLLDDADGRRRWGLSGPGLHSLSLRAEVAKDLCLREGDGGYVRTCKELSYRLESHHKAVMPSEQDWSRLVLGQLLGYYKDAFTFIRVRGYAEGGAFGCMLRVGYDRSDQALSQEDRSWQYIISFLAGVSENADDEFLNQCVPECVKRRLQSICTEEFVLDCLVLLEQHSQSYGRWVKRELLGEDDLYIEEGSVIPVPVHVSEGFASSMHGRLRCLIENLKGGCTHRELLRAAVFPVVFTEGKLSITRAAMSFIQTLGLDAFPIAGRVALVGKILRSFPALSSCLALPGIASQPNTRAEFFLEALKQGHILLTSRFLDEEREVKVESKQKRLLGHVSGDGWTALQMAVKQLDVEMVQLLVGYRPHVNQVLVACISGILCLADAPLRAAAVLLCLFDYLRGPFLNKRVGNERWTLLHHLAHSSVDCSEVVEPLLIRLIQYGASPNIISNEGTTALDVALKENNVRLSNRLVRLGAVCAPHPFNLKLVDQATILPADAAAILKARDLALRWRLNLAAFGKGVEEEVVENPRYEGSLIGPHIGQYSLPKDILNNCNLLKRDRNTIESIFGSGIGMPEWEFADRCELLNPIFLRMSHGVFEPRFFDSSEELGVRFAVQTFFDLLAVQGVAYSELVQVSCNVGSPFTVLMAQKIEGATLKTVLEDSNARDCLESLDRSTFSHLILTSLLVDFEDIKPDSFVVESLPDGTSRLVCIDPKTAFFSVAIHQDEQRAPIKNILFCLDQMLEKVDPTARLLFLAINPHRLIDTWLGLLEGQDAMCGKLFKKDKNYSSGHVRFAAGFITNLYNKIQRLQTILTDLAEPTHLELLVLLHPSLQKYYARAFYELKEQDPISRFASLSLSDERIEDEEGRIGSITKGLSLKRTSTPILRRGVNLDGARKEFAAVLQEEAMTIEQSYAICNGLQEGNFEAIEAFCRLKLDKSKQSVVAQFDFTCLNSFGPNTRKMAVSAISQGYYFSMALRGVRQLTVFEMRMLLNGSPYLQELTIDGVQFLPEVFTELSRARYLRSLTLISFSALRKIDLSNFGIRDLIVKGCFDLEEMTVPVSLKRLCLNECTELDAVHMGGADGAQNLPENFLAELSIQNCSKLQPWERLFSPWYKKERAASLYLTDVPVKPITKTLWYVIQAIARAPKSEAILNALKESEENALRKYIHVLDRYLHSPVEELELPATRITDDDLEVFGGWFPQLKSLKLMGSKELPGLVSDAGLSAFVRNSNHLTSLEIAFCPQVTGIEEIVTKLPGLLSLTMRYCPVKDIVLQQIAQHRHNIRKLAFIGCKDISDEGLVALAHHCKQLESLDFGGCGEITDRGLGLLLKNNPALSTLDVSGCRKLHKSLHESIDACRLRFRHMNLSWSHKAEAITHTLNVLSKHGEELRSLSLSRCSYEVSSLEVCLKMCRNLVYLDLSHGSHLAETDFSSIGDHVLQLETLNLAFCMISDQGFNNLLRGCRNLEILDLSSCRGITKNGLKAIVNGVPRLKVLKFQSASIQGNIRHEDLLALQQSKPDLRLAWKNNLL